MDEASREIPAREVAAKLLKKRLDRQRDHDWRQTMWLAIDLDADIERISLLLESEAEARRKS